MIISDGSAANVAEYLLLELYNIHRDRRAQAFLILEVGRLPAAQVRSWQHHKAQRCDGKGM